METSRYNVGVELTYQVNGPSAFIFNVSVVENAFQKVVSESFSTEPGLPFQEARAATVEKRDHRIVASAGPLTVRYSATVDLSHHLDTDGGAPEVPPGELPREALPYLYPSRYCESDKLMRLTQGEFGSLPAGLPRVTGICNWIFDRVEYLRGSTDPNTSAYDTVTERTGVCRDFAHLGIAFCRALAIPARFVSGYAYGLQPADLHAYFEAFLGGRWYIFDATRLAPQASFIRVGTGRDAADTSFATIFGAVDFQSINVTMEHVSGPRPEYTVSAISTSGTAGA